MNYFRQENKYKVNEDYLSYFLKKYWFSPSDVLQRGIEANIWNLCQFKNPVLDIGVGNGEMSLSIFKNHGQLDVGIDLDENGLESAKKTKKYKKIIHADAQNLPFKNASFNTVVSNSTFEHIENDLKAVSEVARVLKKKGLFFITIPSEFLQKWVLENEKKINKAKSQQNLIRFNSRANHLHYRSLSRWKECFKKYDLKIIFHKYYFSKKTAILWYEIFKKFTYKLGNREVWSILGDSKITKFLPKGMIIELLQNRILKNSYNNGFFIDSGDGAQLFMIAKKI